MNLTKKNPGKRIISLLAVSALALVFAACPYASSVSIDKASVPIDINLLGKWKKGKYTKNYMTVSKKSANQYNLVQFNYNSSKKTYTRQKFSGFISMIGKDRYLNVFNPKNKKYYFYKLEIGKAKITAHPVTGNIKEAFKTSDALKAFIAKHQHLSFFFEKAEVFNRMNK